MCIILLNMNIVYRRLVLMIYLSLRAVMKCTLLNFPVCFWLDMASRTWCADVGYFLPMMSIQKVFLFIAVNAWFHGLLFSDWDMYDMLWCSQYCVVMPMGVPLGGKLTVHSNISYLIKGWSERSIFNVGRVEVFLPRISSKPGDQLLPNLLLCSSNFADEQYLSLFVCGFHHLILALLFV